MGESAPFATLGEHDGGEFKEIYRQHLGFVWRSLRGLGVGENAVEDATHEVFVVLHRRWGDWDRGAKITTWLYGIARGVARNVQRRDRRMQRKLRAVQSYAASDSGSFSSPTRGVRASEATELLNAFLESLDEPKRRVFELCEIEGLTAADAGRCLRESPNTISTRLRRARRQFTLFLEKLEAASG